LIVAEGWQGPVGDTGRLRPHRSVYDEEAHLTLPTEKQASLPTRNEI